MNLSKYLFPYEKIRDVQKDLILKVDSAFQDKKNLIVHAPTGLGKTAATLCPALKHALEKDLTVFFLTSRHTQHLIAIETLKEIRHKYGTKIVTTDIIGKKWMCPVPGTDKLFSNEFSDYCKSVRESGSCEFYSKTKNGIKLTPHAKEILQEAKDISPCHSEKMIELCADERLCPYEITSALSKHSKVVIGDYYYIFNPHIRELFFGKSNKKLENSIIIVDEAHNLPSRLRDLMTHRLSNYMLNRAISEAKKFGYSETKSNIENIKQILEDMADTEEKVVTKRDFSRQLPDYTDLVADFEFIGDSVRESEKQSYIGSIANFLEQWTGKNNGFVRIITKKMLKTPLITLSYRCLDPGMLSNEVAEKAYSTVLMSGTLQPLSMYQDILGFKNAQTQSFESPFPTDNRLDIVIPRTTTKYTERNESQYREIAEICSEVVDTIPGNSIIFFPSYRLRDSVYRYFETRKKIMLETRNLSKKQKRAVLSKFKENQLEGSVLLGVVSGSFGEGIDLPGNLLKGVVVVGLPLHYPDLETKALIKHYDTKFSKGWDYGYLFPAMNRVLQNAGRVIRSSNDKGVVVFLDKRYTWHNYYRCFSHDQNIKVTLNYQKELENFFNT